MADPAPIIFASDLPRVRIEGETFVLSITSGGAVVEVAMTPHGATFCFNELARAHHAFGEKIGIAAQFIHQLKERA